MQPHYRPTFACLAALLALLAPILPAGDWPAFRHDAARSGATPEQLAFPLYDTWTYQPLQAPQPAWPEPGKELHRIDFDYAFQPVAAGGLVLIGSSADDTVRALSAADGSLQWKFTASGPIRFAPTVSNGKGYVASDDGYLYCLALANGAEVWRFRAAPRSDLLLGNSRMISRWPLRAGVLVDQGVAYVAAGIWPSEGIHIYALDAETGRPIWSNRDSGNLYMDLPHATASAFTGVCPQGYLAASRDRLLVPTGRAVPAGFDRQTGRLLFYEPSRTASAGGAWLAVAGETYLNPVHPHRDDDDSFVGECQPREGDGMGIYALRDGMSEKAIPGCQQVAVTEQVFYGAGADFVEAIDRQRLRTGKPANECLLWKVKHPRAYSLVLAGTNVFVGTHGAITAFDAATGRQVWQASFDDQVRGMAVADGRLFAAGRSGRLACFANYAEGVTPATHLREKPMWSEPVTSSHLQRAAAVATHSGVTKGYALVLGEPDARLATALAMRTELHVVCVLTNTAVTNLERQRLVETGLGGSRVALLALEDPARLACASYFADLVVLAGRISLPGEEILRLVKPCGGVLCASGDMPGDALKEIVSAAGIAAGELQRVGSVATYTRGPLPGAGEWRWELGGPGRTGASEERRLKMPAEILWFGGPGPDRMMDRHWRTASPLFVGGQMFVKGQHHVLAFDAYNGREIWSREVRGVGNQEAWWAAGSFVADNDSLYVGTGKTCLRLDQATGQTMANYRLPGLTNEVAVKPPRLVEVSWPTTWQVLGPFPKETPPLPRATLQAMPVEIAVGGRTYAPAPLQAVDGFLDFTYLYGGYGFQPLAPGAQPGPYRNEGSRDMTSEGRAAYAFARINSPQPGRLTIGAGADWWMQWFVDGVPAFDTLAQGNSRFPYTSSNHVFSVDVTAGEHVLCVMVKAGSLSWCLASDGGARFARTIPPVPEEKQVPPWGWTGVAENRVLGIRFLPNGSGRTLFALGRDDGQLRWTYDAKRGLDGTCVAIGDGRIFLTDTTSFSEYRASLGSNAPPQGRTLVALDARTGVKVWEQEQPSTDVFSWWPRALQVAHGTVLLDGIAAFNATNGATLWRKHAYPAKPPVILGDWVIAWPVAYDLHTGAVRETDDVLGRGRRTARFPRAYGCGEVVGCADLLFFRSGMTGVYDFYNEGTTTFGGVRPGCSVNTIPAGGLLLCPEGSSGCSCSYNFQTSLALAPAAAERDVWYTFAGEASTAAITRLHLNFGAPGDRRDTRGGAWLAWPRPAMPGGCAVPAGMSSGQSEPWCRAGEGAPVADTDRPWVYSSGLSATGTLCVLMRNLAPVPILPCTVPPVLDGTLDDPCWKAAAPIPFDNLANLRDPRVELFACRDATNLYFACRTQAVRRDGIPIDFTDVQTGTNANYLRDDACQFQLTDDTQSNLVTLGVSCSGGTAGSVKKRKGGNADQPWYGRWSCRVSKKATEWTTEVVVPLASLAEAGVALDSLQMNFMSQNTLSRGRGKAFLVDPGFVNPVSYRPVTLTPAPLPLRRFTVRLHFAEPDELRAGDRVFHVALQGKRMLENFDIVKEAGSPHTALVKSFPGIEIDHELTIDLTAGAASGKPPLICGLEAVAE